MEKTYEVFYTYEGQEQTVTVEAKDMMGSYMKATEVLNETLPTVGWFFTKASKEVTA